MKSISVNFLKASMCIVGSFLAAPATGGTSLIAGTSVAIGVYNGLKFVGNTYEAISGEKADEIYVTYLNFSGHSENRLVSAVVNAIPDTPLELVSYKFSIKASHACLRIVGENGWDIVIEISGNHDGGEILDKKYHKGGLVSGSSGGETLYLLKKKGSNTNYRNYCLSKTKWGKRRRNMDDIIAKAKQMFDGIDYNILKDNCQKFSRELAKFAIGN